LYCLPFLGPMHLSGRYLLRTTHCAADVLTEQDGATIVQLLEDLHRCHGLLVALSWEEAPRHHPSASLAALSNGRESMGSPPHCACSSSTETAPSSATSSPSGSRSGSRITGTITPQSILCLMQERRPLLHLRLLQLGMRLDAISFPSSYTSFLVQKGQLCLSLL
jgi:hypothetical protein